jgi:hypothetical protein
VALASDVRGCPGATLEQRPVGGEWQSVRTVGAGAARVAATVTAPTDYRLATTTEAAGSVRIRVMPAVSLAAVTAAEVDGSMSPVLMGATVDVQQQSPDQTWTSIGTATVGEDGAFSVPVSATPGASVRAVVTAGAGWAPGTSATQIVGG